MPNPDGTQTPAERQKALMATARPAGFSSPEASQNAWMGFDDNHYKQQIDAQIADGRRLAGQHTYDKENNVQNELFGNLSDAEAQAKQQGDFGLGTNNNAATAAMLGNAQATGDKYSSVFGAAANNAAALSGAAGARGTQMYAGDTSAYGAGLAAAQQDRGMQTGAYGALMDFANRGPGPSAAEAQLAQATGANTQNALALARSGRGMGGGAAAMRQAIAQNAATQQGAVGQAAELRANENTAFQGQRLNAMSGAGTVAGQVVQGDQGTAASGLSGAQYATNTKLQGTQLNDASSQAWALQQQQAQQQGLGAEVGAQTQQLNINASALAGRESQWASANQEHATDAGVSTQAGIADANRQSAYFAAGMSAAAPVIAAVSDERVKTNVMPLGSPAQPTGSQVQPLNNQAPAQPASAASSPQGPTNAQKDEAQHEATGGTVGQVGGAVAGTAIGGPIGGVIGSVIGKALGKFIGSDIRSKDNIQPLGVGASRFAKYLQADNRQDTVDPWEKLNALSTQYGAGGVASDPKAVKDYAKVPAKRFADVPAPPTARFADPPASRASSGDPYEALVKFGASAPSESTRLPASQEAGFQKWLKANNVRDLDNPESHYDYRGAYLAGVGRGSRTGHFPDTFKQHGHPTFSVESQYSKSSNDGGTWNGERFSPAVSPRAPDTDALDAAFTREGGRPIVSEGDKLLADSARNAPGSMYEYKDPADGAGTYTGPMAQDLARHPVTQGVVGQDPNSGKLYVDGARAALTGMAQNHSQQNQLDALDAKIAKLHDLISGSSPYPEPTAPDADGLDDARRRYPRAAAY